METDTPLIAEKIQVQSFYAAYNPHPGFVKFANGKIIRVRDEQGNYTKKYLHEVYNQQKKSAQNTLPAPVLVEPSLPDPNPKGNDSGTCRVYATADGEARESTQKAVMNQANSRGGQKPLGGDVENTKVREAASPSQFPSDTGDWPSIEAQANYWEHCCDDCDEIEARMREAT